MTPTQERVLTAREAARVIYQTDEPTEEQINKVRASIARGHLPASSKGHLTTTQEALAEYLARGTVARHYRPAGAQRATGELRGYYRHLLKDYFLAVTLRRKASHRSRWFDRAVLAGQIGCLLLAAVLAVRGYRMATALTTPPEQVAVERWIEEQSGPYKIVEWFPAQSHAEGLAVRVRYKYFENRRPITTDRTLLVADDRVVRMLGPDADDE